jgi:hypothetical protein
MTSFWKYSLGKWVQRAWRPDEEFPASVICLFSQNALSFMPLDGLADVAEYTSKAISQLIKENQKT